MTVAEIPVMRRRLTRLDGLYPGYSIYFVTACTHERRSLLACPAIHDRYRSFCDLARQRNVWVGRYVIMPDHIHLFVNLPDEVEISTWMKSLKNSLSKALREADC